MALRVQVQTLAGAIHEIWADSKCTVLQVKLALEEQAGIPVSNQVLLRECEKLEDTFSPFIDGNLSPLTVLCVKTLQGFLEKSGFSDINAFTHGYAYTVPMVAVLLGEAAFCVEVLENEDFHKVNHEDLQERTVLHLAAARGPNFEDVCGAVLARKGFCKASHGDRSGRTALHYAAESGLATVCAQLLVHDPGLASKLTRASRSPLHVAAEKGQGSCCRALLDVGTAKEKDSLLFLKDTSHCGSTALHLAALANSPCCCNVLLDIASDKQALLMARNDMNFTSLHAAVSANSNSGSCCRALLENAPDPDDVLLSRNGQGRCALHFAAQHGDHSCCEVLLSATCDQEELILAEDKLGRTALDEARATQNSRCLELLSKAVRCKK